MFATQKRNWRGFAMMAVFSCGLLLTARGVWGATPSPNHIRFRSGEVATARKSPTELAASVSTMVRSGGAHFVIQFSQPVTDETRTKLAAAGVSLQSYVGDNAFFATREGNFDSAALSRVSTVSDVLAMRSDWKLHNAFLQNSIPSWALKDPAGQVGVMSEEQRKLLKPEERDAARKEPPQVAAYLMFHKDVPLTPNGVNIALRHGATIRSVLTGINALVVEMPLANVQVLAGEDEVQWIEPPLPSLTGVNDSNRARTGADIVQAAPYNLSGAGVSVLVYDGGLIRTTHVDFQGRAVNGPEPACETLADHSTHVAGTIGGGGVANPNLKGMAPGVSIVGHALNQGGGCSLSQGFLYTDPGDMQADYTDAIVNFGADIANNSIGTNTAPNGFPCSWEGDYGVTDVLIDSIVRGTAGIANGQPFRVVWANGNERNSGRCGTTYHTTAPPACAKNHITVGALNSNDDSVTTFTSWGPADDGRMKPDLSGPGCQSNGDGGVTSCSASSDTSYTVFCGTSMASPTVCGISSLLMQDYRAQFPLRPDPRNSTLKILLAQTAVDLFNTGPDYQTGYGSVRIQPAIDFMRSGNFLENSVSQGGSYNVLVLVNPGDPMMKVTLAWDDAPGTPNVDPALVNDLDLVVFDPSNTQRFPWTLDPANPANPAVQTQANRRDNIEQVAIPNPTPGVYRIEVRGFNVPNGPQAFSLCGSPQLINCSRTGVIVLDRAKYPCSATATIRVIDCDLNTNDNVIETVSVTIKSTSEPAGETVVLTETGAQTAAFAGTIPLSTSNSVGTLQIADGDTITATYIDADDGQGHTNVVVNTTATVDCVAPVISNVQTINIGPRKATITFDTNEPASGTVRWGTSCGSLTNTVAGSGLNTSHSINITGLSPSTTYYFAVDAVDAAGNSSTSDNGGACHSFSTPVVPDFFTEIFESGDNDLDNRQILFTPDASVSRYKACSFASGSLPTDPTGGTPITTWTGTSDDGNSLVTLGGGATVKLYGVSYGSFYVTTNGYLTFVGGETAYSESLTTHFATPHVSALFDDLNPGTGGTVSWKQLADRVAVTWQNVPEYNTSNQNTFQIELYFDGRISLNYAAIAATDGLAGLSDGTGLSVDFTETDLTALTGGCGPLPPSAAGTSDSVAANAIKLVTLPASDPNGDPLTYRITALPPHGTLKDPNGSVIASVPYTLAASGNQVLYKGTLNYQGTDGFQYKANDGTFDSNVGTVTMTVGGPQPIYTFPLDADPGWSVQGQWAFGQPTGGGSHNRDPNGGFTGNNVYGYNLAGDYPNSMASPQYLTTPAINCSGATGVQVRFRRRLGVESATYDHATIDVSTNGTTWTNIWNHTGAALDEATWSQQTYSLLSADNQPTVYIRWGMGPTDGSVTYPGWNIDDVEILGVTALSCGAVIPGDTNGDGKVNGADVQTFSRVFIDPFQAAAAESCAADVNQDNALTPADFPAMVQKLLTTP